MRASAALCAPAIFQGKRGIEFKRFCCHRLCDANVTVEETLSVLNPQTPSVDIRANLKCRFTSIDYTRVSSHHNTQQCESLVQSSKRALLGLRRRPIRKLPILGHGIKTRMHTRSAQAVSPISQAIAARVKRGQASTRSRIARLLLDVLPNHVIQHGL